MVVLQLTATISGADADGVDIGQMLLKEPSDLDDGTAIENFALWPSQILCCVVA